MYILIPFKKKKRLTWKAKQNSQRATANTLENHSQATELAFVPGWISEKPRTGDRCACFPFSVQKCVDSNYPKPDPPLEVSRKVRPLVSGVHVCSDLEPHLRSLIWS